MGERLDDRQPEPGAGAAAGSAPPREPVEQLSLLSRRQARAFVEGPAGPTRVEDMAETYLEEIRSMQPAGPYYLGGHSAGGTVAYEMACRLAQGGERVAIVALFVVLGAICAIMGFVRMTSPR